MVLHTIYCTFDILMLSNCETMLFKDTIHTNPPRVFLWLRNNPSEVCASCALMNLHAITLMKFYSFACPWFTESIAIETWKHRKNNRNTQSDDVRGRGEQCFCAIINITSHTINFVLCGVWFVFKLKISVSISLIAANKREREWERDVMWCQLQSAELIISTENENWINTINGINNLLMNVNNDRENEQKEMSKTEWMRHTHTHTKQEV